MPFDPNQFNEGASYDAEITAATMTASEEKGTPGLYLKAITANGEIDGTLWITPNTVDRVRKTLNDLGISDDVMESAEFCDDPGARLNGTICSIVPKIEEYNGKEFWRVQWWNGRRSIRAADGAAKDRARNLLRRPDHEVADASWAGAPPPTGRVPF